MLATKRSLPSDGLIIELEDGRRIFVDDILAEARNNRAAELGRLLIQGVAWARQLLTPLRASLADRALELPGNRAALQMAAACRTDAALGHFAGEPGEIRNNAVPGSAFTRRRAAA